jgi:hypothetical protein
VTANLEKQVEKFAKVVRMNCRNSINLPGFNILTPYWKRSLLDIVTSRIIQSSQFMVLEDPINSDIMDEQEGREDTENSPENILNSKIDSNSSPAKKKRNDITGNAQTTSNEPTNDKHFGD